MVIKERRRKLNIHNISDNKGNNIEGYQSIADAVINHFEELFKDEEIRGRFRILDKVPQVVTEDMNTMVIVRPTAQEVTNAINNIKPNSAPGPDGFGTKFFQTCIDIILLDIHNVVLEFFDGAHVPRIGKILPDIISPNQSGFIQGRSITDNVLLAQELLLSIMLNKLIVDDNYSGYYRPKKGPSITHLAFADDIIIFTSGKPSDIRKILKLTTIYENVSGQLIKENKSCVAFASKANLKVIHRLTHLTKMNRKEWPLKYLGCPLFVGRMKINYFSEMVNSITSRIQSWHAKFLSKGGKIVLIKHVLSTMPVRLLAVMKPPKGTFEQIQGAMT
ncbi:uncharacterized protein LOC132624198 [Lycium barbarum]|uniref:uncharacterized protein LOC132624198 n=1 Tax=Lycium barbarum TaxID=112863 RepID=UPI00293E7960|nr:uncharacterized protein LOC132624198 [Lycium barbarum]